jgi:ubiquinone/menaquinone biosynthesis C-methylase UbiE
VTSPDVETWDRLSQIYAADVALTPPERSMLARLRGSWQDLDVLDLGVGAGRTAYTLSTLARSYVGVDFSPQMIEHARRRVEEDDRTSFVVRDVRDLSPWHGRNFGLVLFSFNGLDAIEPGDRGSVLSEVRRVIAEDGLFAFSSHSLHALPFDAKLRAPSLHAPIRSTYRSIRRTIGLARANRRLDLETAWGQGWTLVRDDAHDFALVLCYVSPAYQVAELARVGFPSCEVLDMAGRVVDPQAPGSDPHLFYIARPG